MPTAYVDVKDGLYQEVEPGFNEHLLQQMRQYFVPLPDQSQPKEET
jgi:hypothetical protein